MTASARSVEFVLTQIRDEVELLVRELDREPEQPSNHPTDSVGRHIE